MFSLLSALLLALLVGLPAGSSIELALQRTAGAFFLTFNGTPLLFVEPDFLNGRTDLQVGIFAANSGNPTPKPAIIDDFFVDVVEIPEPGGSGLLVAGLAGLQLGRRIARRLRRA